LPIVDNSQTKKLLVFRLAKFNYDNLEEITEPEAVEKHA
jgi:hypothetical protein